MPNFFVLNSDVDAVKRFFSVLPEDQRPRIVSDKDHPAAWDHVSDDPQVIVTDEPRADADAKEIDIEGRQVDEVMQEMQPPADVSSDEPIKDVPEPQPEPERVRGPMTYADRGFKVGRLI